MAESSERPRVLVLVYSPLARDARVLRQVRRLSRSFDVTSAAFGASPVEGVEHIELASLPPYRGGALARLRYAASFLLGRFGALTARDLRDRAALALLVGREWDLVIANDANTLPLAARLRSRHGVLADLHEFAPRQGEESLLFRLTEGRYFRWVLRRYLPSATRVTTVSPGIADEYAREFGVRAEVVTNAAAYAACEPRPVGSPIRLVHSAAPSRARHIEVMIQAVRDTRADVTLDLYLIDDGSDYLDELRALADGIGRATIHPPVPSDRLVETLAAYDVGVHLLPPINANHRWALPNKLFDFVQARLGVIVGPSPEMQRLVTEHGLGAVTDDFTSAALARTLDALTPERVSEWKWAAHAAARKVSGEVQLDRFEGIVREALAASPAPSSR